jgi:acyl dehydratase
MYHFDWLKRHAERAPDKLALVEAHSGREVSYAARRTFTTNDLAEYADLGDTNPIFSDTDHARKLGYSAPVIPGGLLGGLFSYLLGTELPGQGTSYLKQRMVFEAPAHPEEALMVTVEITRLGREKQLVDLRTQCSNSAGQVICCGEALVLVSDVGAS